MKISELFRRLSVGELSNLSMSNDGAGTITKAKQPMIILHANTTMGRLFSRFALRLRETDIQTVEGQREYPLAEDAIKVLTVWDSDGQEFALNARGDRWSMQTPNPTLLKVPAKLRPQVLTVEYQAKPDPIVLDAVEPDYDFEIDLPEILHPALTAYIAAEVYGAMNGKEHAAIAANHRNKFEDICSEIELRDMLAVEQAGRFAKFDKRGWV